MNVAFRALHQNVLRRAAVLFGVVVLGASLASCGSSAAGDPGQNLSQAVRSEQAQLDASPSSSVGGSEPTGSAHTRTARKGEPSTQDHGRKGLPENITLTEISAADQFMDYVKRACGSIYGGPNCLTVTYQPKSSVGLANCTVDWTSSSGKTFTDSGADVLVKRYSRITAVLSDCDLPVTDSPTPSDSATDPTDSGSPQSSSSPPTDQTESSPTS